VENITYSVKPQEEIVTDTVCRVQKCFTYGVLSQITVITIIFCCDGSLASECMALENCGKLGIFSSTLWPPSMKWLCNWQVEELQTKLLKRMHHRRMPLHQQQQPISNRVLLILLLYFFT